uniref:MHC class II alpha n=1 Tax=Oplegnathus punctatus TaxID=163135 RepID=A0A4D6FZF5_OPLPU|nr:MHC class II alpha [Oplegnathus punctatus]
MKMMMKMLVLVLVLSGVLSVSADSQHEDLAITGCSDSDGEAMYALDGEEKWYADFIKQRGVEPQPDFIDHGSYPDPGAYQQAVANQQICRGNLKNSRKFNKDMPLEKDPPSSLVIYPRDDVELGEKNHLLCHVTGFYPAPVKVYWTKNGENVTEGTSINVPFPNKDGSFNQISRLEFIPQLGDMYSCTVKHLALKQPLTRIWDVEVKQPSIGPAVFCGLGLTVGLLGVAAGTFFLIKGNECS